MMEIGDGQDFLILFPQNIFISPLDKSVKMGYTI